MSQERESARGTDKQPGYRDREDALVSQFLDHLGKVDVDEAERRETEEILSSRSRKSRIMKGLRQSREGKVRYIDEK